MSSFSALFRLIRVDQWIKNVLVFIPLVFAVKFTDVEALQLGLIAFAVFSLASSAVYVLNDLFDMSYDLVHPFKKSRPLPAGEVSEGTALILFGFLFVAALMGAMGVSSALFFVVLVYLLLNLAYSYWLKHLLFVDVLAVASFYVLRVVAGAVAVGVRVSEWMVVLIFLLALFSVVSKRRQEVKLLKRKAKTRRVLSYYSVELLDQVNGVIVPVLLVAYIFYTFQAKIHSPFMLATIPVVAYAFLRFLYLVRHTDWGMSSSDYKKDLGIVVAGGIWFGLVGLALLGY